MSINSDLLNEMVRLACSASMVNEEPFAQAWQILQQCDLNETQLVKIMDIICFPPEVNSQEAMDAMKQEIITVLSEPQLNVSDTIISTTCTASTTSVCGLASDSISDRKEAAKKRLGEIFNMSNGEEKSFEPNAAILTFDLDALLESYAENHNPNCLLELVDWAGIRSEEREEKREGLRQAIFRYRPGLSEGEQERLVRVQFSKLFSYFDQKKKQSGVSQEDLKVQYREVVNKIINANRNCVDQMLSQLQDMVLDIAVEGYVPTEGDKILGKIQCMAGQEICKYKIELLRDILHRQNPHEPHLADLERVAMKKLADVLGLKGAAFISGARYGHILGNVHDRINQAVNTFWEEYRPMEYLMEQLCKGDGRMYKLRNALLLWSVEHYGILEEDADEVTATDMNPILSSNFNPKSTRDNFCDGGVWSLGGTFFLLEAAGLIQQGSNSNQQRPTIQVQGLSHNNNNNNYPLNEQPSQTHSAFTTENVFRSHTDRPSQNRTNRGCPAQNRTNRDRPAQQRTTQRQNSSHEQLLIEVPEGLSLNDFIGMTQQQLWEYLQTIASQQGENIPIMIETEWPEHSISGQGFNNGQYPQTYGSSSSMQVEGNTPLVVGGFSPSGLSPASLVVQGIDHGPSLGVGSVRGFGATDLNRNNNNNNNVNNNVNNNNVNNSGIYRRPMPTFEEFYQSYFGLFCIGAEPMLPSLVEYQYMFRSLLANRLPTSMQFLAFCNARTRAEQYAIFTQQYLALANGGEFGDVD